MRFEWCSRSAAETRCFGELLGAGLRAPVWLGLSGPLGAGKTLLAAGIAAGLGYRGRVRSPTFVIENRYLAPTPIRHLDLYRLETPDDELVASWDEDDRSVFLVEWSERAQERPARSFTIELALADLPEARWIRLDLECPGELLRELHLERLWAMRGTA